MRKSTAPAEITITSFLRLCLPKRVLASLTCVTMRTQRLRLERCYDTRNSGSQYRPVHERAGGLTINGGFTGTLIGYSASVPWIRASPTSTSSTSGPKIVHNHTVKAGVDLRRVRDDLLAVPNLQPSRRVYLSDVQLG